MIDNFNISCEEKLLCGLCRLSFNAEQTGKLNDLSEKITEWSYFSSLARQHGISALVYNNMAKLGLLDHITPEITNNLWNTFMMNLARNVSFTAKMAEVLNLLNSQNIKTVLLKGLALELTVYGNSGLRQMTDVDILVSMENSLKARNILMENGFISNPVKSVFHKMILTESGKHLPTLTKEGFAVEIHNQLFGTKRSFLTKILYNESFDIDLNGNKTYIPRARMFFIYLIKHLSLHEMNNESQLRLYTDLVIMIEKHRDEIFDPDLLVLAGEAGMEKNLATYLCPLRDIMGITFPVWLNNFIDKWSDSGADDKFLFFLKNPKDNPPSDKGKVYRYHLSNIRGLHRKILFVAGDLFPTMEFMKKRYRCDSKLRALMYYPLRFGKLWYLIK